MISKLRQRLQKDQEGFTLIELLVVIIIIGILLAIAVPSYLGFRDRANNKAAAANVRAIVPSMEAYFADNGAYDTASPALTAAHLKATYDQGINAASYTINGLTPTSYCVSSTVGNKTARKPGPGVAIIEDTTAC